MSELPAFAAELLYQSRVARLATADRAGQPLVVPVCYVFDGRVCFSALDAKPKRLAPSRLRRVRNIAENPRVSLTVDRYDEDWSQLCWVIVQGRADILTGDPNGRARSTFCCPNTRSTASWASTAKAPR